MANERRAPRRPVDVGCNGRDRVVDGRRRRGRVRHDVHADDASEEATQPSDRPDSRPGIRGGPDGGTPVRLDPELARRVRERAARGREPHRTGGDGCVFAFELRDGVVLVESAHVDARDPSSRGKLGGRAGEREAHEDGGDGEHGGDGGEPHRHRAATTPPPHARPDERRLGTHGGRRF